MTGIDRVEFAYLRELAHRDEPLFALIRTPFGYLLLDQRGARDMADRIEREDFGRVDLLSRFGPKRSETARRAEADARRLASGRALPQRLKATLKAHLPTGVRYINVGHANFTPRVIHALSEVNAQIAVMVHDFIPMEAPQWQRPKSVTDFKRFIRRVDAHADVLIFTAQTSEKQAGQYLKGKQKAVTAHLGLDLPEVAKASSEIPSEPNFISVGTIEARKNHAFLLDIWELMGDRAPLLIIAGQRGWRNEDVFKRLDNAGPNIREMAGLNDAELATLVAGARAMIFPSNMEGFGLPPMEAAARGVAVLCQPLPSLKEVMGDIPIYLDASDPYPWAQEIEKLIEQRCPPQIFRPPTWTDHFNTVLMLT